MDAFSVSMANGLNEPEMKTRKEHLIAGIFGFFQFLMPMIGWICVHTIAEAFREFNKFIPWIALVLLLYIGIKMIIEGIRNKDGKVKTPAVDTRGLILQAVATSIDALSVGFTIASTGLSKALIECLIIGIVTYGISYAGIKIGKKFGTMLAGKASILGGVILVLIGLEIFIKGMLGA